MQQLKSRSGAILDAVGTRAASEKMKEKLHSELFLFPMVWYFLICKAVGTIS